MLDNQDVTTFLVAAIAALPRLRQVLRCGAVKRFSSRTTIGAQKPLVTTSLSDASGLDGSIESFILAPSPDEREFDRLARALFAYQYANNEPYRRLCEQHGLEPADVLRWQDIPAVSAASFADARLACFLPACTNISFVSSGTTRATSGRSIHELDTTKLYDASLLTHFRACVLPDRDDIRMLMLSPPFEEALHSSLAYMLSKVFERHASGGGFFVHDDVLDYDGLAAALRAGDEPVLLFGSAFAFVHFLDACAVRGDRFPLPSSSRIVETGGFKGKSRSVERDELYGSLTQTFGVDSPYCIAEYGMCELGSQWYDAALADKLAGRSPREGCKVGPHWARILAVDPVSGQPVADGEQGLLQVVDLSNRGSVAAVLTGDLVIVSNGGFRLLGRSPAAPPKGCSITIDAALASRG